MYYNGKNMPIEKYLETRLFEDGFITEDDIYVDGYHRDEATFNALAEYVDSCDINTIDELDFIESLGYKASDFKGNRNYEVSIESGGGTKRILYYGDNIREAIECYDAYNNWGGDYMDENQFVWSLYFDEEEIND